MSKQLVNIIVREKNAVNKSFVIGGPDIVETKPLIQKLKSAFKSINTMFTTYVYQPIGKGVKSLVSSIGNGFKNVAKAPLTIFKNLGNNIVDTLITVLTSAISVFEGITSAFMAMTTAIISNPIGAAIAAIVAALALATASLGAFFTRTEEGANQWTLMKAKATGYFNGVMDAFANIGKSIMNGETTYGKFIKTVGGWIVNIIVTPLKWIGSFLNTLIEMLTGVNIAEEAEKSA
jgi:hypothetical protein